MDVNVVAMVMVMLACAWTVSGQPSGGQQPSEGDIKLQRFDSQYVDGTGNVMVYHDGQWGYVCDDGWNLESATIVCHSLGYTSALGYTVQSHFGIPEDHPLWLDNVQCFGHERYLLDCQMDDWGEHNCDHREAAGVFCVPTEGAPQLRRNRKRKHKSTTTTTTTTTTSTTTKPYVQVIGHEELGLQIRGDGPKEIHLPSVVNKAENDVLKASVKLGQTHGSIVHFPDEYQVRIREGRNEDEGRVEVHVNGVWGVVCSDNWSLLEARVVCGQIGRGYARTAMRGGFFGGENMIKMAGGVHCDGNEAGLHECYHTTFGHNVACKNSEYVAGVVCTQALPDLVPNATLLYTSTYLEDRQLYYLQCAMEEGCASSSAYTIKETRQDWHVQRRRLLRFSSSTWNFGTADFRPLATKGDWEWHECHMHYHSMAVFATYDLMDHAGNKIAEGHKASFCLEDVQCSTGVSKKFACKGYGDQGISIGCADDYLHDIDCQWIDITDVPIGSYIFKVHVNPNYLVGELRYDNNAVTCELEYTGFNVRVTKCVLGEG